MNATDVLVLGAGRSGSAVAEYCAARAGRFSSVTLVDSQDSSSLREETAGLSAMGVRVILGASATEGSYSLCVASPGIKPSSDIMRWAHQSASEVISEIEFAYRESESSWVAVTGTNGKTTTTALIAHILSNAGMHAPAVGNIGSAAIAAVAEERPNTVLVAEVSSFQLALTSRFHPCVAVLLNVTPDHVDWHGSLEDYTRDKAKIFANMGSGDTAVIDVDDEGSCSWVVPVRASGARVVEVSVESRTAGTANANGGMLSIDPDGSRIPLLPADELKIRGPHNVSNALAAAAAAYACGISPDLIRAGIAGFEPIEHRLELVATISGADWYNDSKATNPDAVMKALAAFGDQPLVLLLGGRNKGNDFEALARAASEAAREVVLFGEAREELLKAFRNVTAVPLVVKSLQEAVVVAASVARPGDAVVLSPACASFDQFESFEARGDEFKRLVQRLGDEA